MEGDRERELDWRLDIRDHSATGFEWGYGGSGPAQLAVAICCDCLGDAIGSDPGVYQQFKWDLVSSWDCDWEMTEPELRQWAESLAQTT